MNVSHIIISDNNSCIVKILSKINTIVNQKKSKNYHDHIDTYF